MNRCSEENQRWPIEAAQGASAPDAIGVAGTANVDDARVDGVIVGVNMGQIIYGRDPQADEQRRLVWYLKRLSAKLNELSLRGLDQQAKQGTGLALSQIYVMLATTRSVVEHKHRDAIRDCFEEHDPTKALKSAHHPDWALPADARCVRDEVPRTDYVLVERALLAAEAVQQNPHLVVLGEPGSGKSTFVWHLAWAMARRGLDQLCAETTLHGWDATTCLLPILLPCRTLARHIAEAGARATTLSAALRAEMQSYDIQPVDDLLNESLHHGAALLLLDGLDEVPVEASDMADRMTTLQAIHAFAQLHPQARIVVTCRTHAFASEMRDLLDWPVETIALFTLGQIHHFVNGWYSELALTSKLTGEQAARLKQDLIDAIIANPKLRAMAETPLLLVMMALILYNKGELPRDRPQLYERILELLLGQWDRVRDGQSLAEAIGQPSWGIERLLPLLDQLSYQAHAEARSRDGRGRLQRSTVSQALIDFFTAARVPQPWSMAGRCLDYFEQRSGLLLPNEDDYVFAHLTLQEHGAGRHIALGSEDPAALLLRHRTDDRWREPIFLGMGLVHPAVLGALLRVLIDREEHGRPKPDEVWYRDLILAAEIGVDRDWDYLRTRPMVKVDQLQAALQKGLVELLRDSAQPLAAAARVRAGVLLGDLGDPRFPVTVEQWRYAVEQAQAGDLDAYFCRVDAGNYLIGSADDDPSAYDNEKPQHAVTFDAPFWIARYPITFAQWQVWVKVGGEPAHYALDPDLNRRNQPVVGITWQMCNDFCAWLSTQLGATMRLPSEREWAAAARGPAAWRYPWGNEWLADRAATAEDRETRGQRWSVPVGCYPAGAAACGALDMAGNVCEWTADNWRSYPSARPSFAESGRRVLRGGSYQDNRSDVRCAARNRTHPSNNLLNDGFRVVLALRCM
jgi:Sulfatase-modifying factor enzyme 1/NACHT domain